VKIFHYDFDGNIIGESEPSGKFLKEYLYMGDVRLAMVDVPDESIYMFINDNLGTPQALTDEERTAVWQASYLPFGKALVNPNSSIINNFRFPGQYYDGETGLHYNYHRYYEPSTGRYLMADPIGQAGGLNIFAYTLNNPINFIDPLGLEDIVILYATDVKDKSINDWFLNKLIAPPYKIVEAAKKAGKTVKVDKTAKKSEILDAYSASDTERMIIIAHGVKQFPYFVDCEGKGLEPNDFSSKTKGLKLTEIDLLSCHQYEHEKAWEKGTKANINTHDNSGYLWWWEIKKALKKTIPKSVK
jgi:RHS repeat-associated protein